MINKYSIAAVRPSNLANQYPILTAQRDFEILLSLTRTSVSNYELIYQLDAIFIV